MTIPPKGWNSRVPFTEAIPGHLYRLLMVATRSIQDLGGRLCVNSSNRIIAGSYYQNEPDVSCIFISMNKEAYYAIVLVGEQLIRVQVDDFSHQSTGIKEWLEEYEEIER